jgi:uncharacterized protein (DUF488 family)
MKDSNIQFVTVFSIGHGSKEVNEFLEELKSFDIRYLLDIRSRPFSKWYPQYNQFELQSFLEANGIKYVFLGDDLGGLPSDRSCYGADGKVIYELVKDKDFFKNGVRRLITANEKQINVVVMCSESKPEECHRSKLIGEELLRSNISIKHIVSKGVFKTQESVINELTQGKGTVDLFGESINLTSRKSYK